MLVYIVLSCLGAAIIWGLIDMVSDYRSWNLAEIHFEAWVKEHEYDHDREVDLAWDIIASANRRRKRIEKVLRRERAAHMKVTLTMSRHIHEAGQEFEQLQDKYYALAADVVEDLLRKQEEEKVKKSLTRKVKKKEPK